jgi:hypothetical protein
VLLKRCCVVALAACYRPVAIGVDAPGSGCTEHVDSTFAQLDESALVDDWGSDLQLGMLGVAEWTAPANVRLTYVPALHIPTTASIAVGFVALGSQTPLASVGFAVDDGSAGLSLQISSRPASGGNTFTLEDLDHQADIASVFAPDSSSSSPRVTIDVVPVAAGEILATLTPDAGSASAGTAALGATSAMRLQVFTGTSGADVFDVSVCY